MTTKPANFAIDFAATRFATTRFAAADFGRGWMRRTHLLIYLFMRWSPCEPSTWRGLFYMKLRRVTSIQTIYNDELMNLMLSSHSAVTLLMTA